MELKHECEENDRGPKVEYHEVTKRWYLKGVEDWIIYYCYYCPYCGIKLEPPEMIEVSRKMLHEWISGIDKVQRHVAQETVGQTCARLVKVTRSIEAAMYDREDNWGGE